MKPLIALVFLTIFPFMAYAQPLRVQTGEHDRFTRVVVPLPAGAGWQFGRTENGYALRLAVADGYDLRSFFNRIPRTRISAVSQNTATGDLMLELACECRADIEVFDRAYLVIDISNGVPDADSVYEQLIFGDQSAIPPWSVTGGGKTSALFPVILPRIPRAVFDDSFMFLGRDAAPPLPRPVQDELIALETLVVGGLGRGMSSGLLEPDLTPAETTRPILDDIPLTSWPGLTVSTGIDSVASRADDQLPMTADGKPCVADAFLDVASWSDDRPFTHQIGDLRSSIMHEFDRVDPQAAEKLAQLYLYFGFGREAIQTLALDGVTSNERAHLRTLAQIVDDDPVSFPDAQRQLTCPSRIALWAFLSVADDRSGRHADPSVVLAAFKEISAPLQSQLGPRLAERFVANGNEDAAFQVLAAARTFNPDAVETRLAVAMLEEQSGDDTAGLNVLASLVEDNVRVTPQAVTRLLTESIRHNRPVADNEMITADALRFEQARTPDAVALAVAQVHAHLVAGAFDKAAEIIMAEGDRFAPDQLAALRRDYGMAAAERMPDEEFLTYAVDPIQQGDAADVQNKTAERLIALGFPELALQRLGSTSGADDERRYLQATALLFMRDADAVIRLLSDDQTARSADLIQAARDLRAGNMTATGQTSETTDAQAGWRNGQWSSLLDVDDPMLRDVAAVVLNRDAVGFDANAPLASGRALLDAAAGSRVLLDDLLDRFDLPADD